MLRAVRRRSGTVLITIFLVTLSFRKVRPLIRPRVVGFAWVDREGLIVCHIHVWLEEIQEHVPSPNESVLIDAGEETSKILIEQSEVAVSGCTAED